jgi:hypothetical protein
MPATISANFQGTVKEFQKSFQGLSILLIVAILVIYIVLGILYESFVHPLTILSGLPAQPAGLLRAALTSPQTTVDLFNINSGVFPYTSRDWKFSHRLDHRISGVDQLFFHYLYDNLDESNASVRALVGASRGTNLRSLNSNLSAGWMHFFTGRTMNEARAQWNASGAHVAKAVDE